MEGSQRKGYWSGKIRTPGLSCLSIDSADYEAGNIVARFYVADSVPDEQVLKDDLRAMLALYDVLANSVGKPLLRGWNPKNMIMSLLRTTLHFDCAEGLNAIQYWPRR